MIAVTCVTLALVVGQAAPGNADRDFAALADEYLSGHFAFRPAKAVALGLHDYDGQMPDYSAPSLARQHERLKRFDRRLSDFPVEQLSAEAQLDLRILHGAVRESLFSFEQTRSYWRNPLVYPRAASLNDYLTRNYAPLDVRVRAIIAAAKQIPKLLADGRENLESTLPQPKVETAIKVANGTADFLSRDLLAAVSELRDDALLKELREVSQVAAAAAREYAQWLQTEALPRADHRFALGEDKYAQMLRDEEWVTKSSAEILELGLRELRKEQAVFTATARMIDSTKPPIEVFYAIQNDHPTAENLIPDTRKNLEAIRQFVLDHKIVTVPSEVRALVAETPPYSRATSFASMNSPGPFETKANEAFYYVTPVDPAWTAVQQHEWLTAFNYYTTDVVSIHEAYPGHYVQHLHLNASPVSRIRKIFGSYAFIEGWAHYTEQMLLDEGFPADGDPIRVAKYRLAQSDEALLRLCRLCCSIQMHCGDMSVDEATRFFQDNCYYQEQPARQEAVRGTFDPGYLHYALGKLMILKLRDDWQRQEGERYTLQRFHDEFLRHGMPPLPLLRRAMLKDPATWDQAL